MKVALDVYDSIPKYMRIYLQNYGWHFNKALCEYAISVMRKKGKPLESISKEYLDKILKLYNITINNKNGHDYVFVANNGKSKLYGNSISDEKHLAMYVKDIIDNEDSGEGSIMREWYASMIAKGMMIDWEEYI